jgi:uncharacterized membrane protein YfcA
MPAMDIFAVLVACLLLGAFAGALAGLLGVGGGLLIVPALAVIYQLQGLHAGVVMQLAVGTSLASIVLTSLSSTLAHQRHNAVRWSLVAQLSAGILAGGWLSGFLAVRLGGDGLAALFGLFELAVAWHMFAGRQAPAGRAQPGRLRNGLAGGVIGVLSALLGIGGGTLTVPWLTWQGVDIRHAVATSAACGLPIALAGAAGFVASGWGHPGLPAGSSGFVYWPAVAGIGAASVLTAPLGARLAHRIHRQRLRRAFALLLVCLGVLLLSRTLWA